MPWDSIDVRRDEDEPAAPDLTERELAVLQTLANVGTTDRVARALYLSPHTVKSHYGAIFAKLGARNQAHAVAIGFRLGLIR